MIFCDSSHLQDERERPYMKRKYTNFDKAQWKQPKLTTLISEVSSDTNMQSKEAHVLQCKSQSKTRAEFEESECRSRHWSTWSGERA